MPSAHRRSSSTLKYAGLEGVDAIVFAVRQVDATNPPFDAAAAKAQFAGDLPDGSATFK